MLKSTVKINEDIDIYSGPINRLISILIIRNSNELSCFLFKLSD